jgi:hypothetical protein
MPYYIFLKSLRSLGEFKKNPHFNISPKSPSSLCQAGPSCQLRPSPPAAPPPPLGHPAPPNSAPRVPPSRYHPTIIPPPPIFNGVKAINAPVNPDHPSPALPRPYKNHPDDPRSTSHLTEPFSSPLPRRNPSPPSSRDLVAPPPSPGRHTTARAPVRPEPNSPCSSLSFAPPPVSFGALERPKAVLR